MRDIRTIDELHVKVDTVYHYELGARDVLHSFSVPVFRLKQDAVPGRIIKGWFKANKTGEWDIQCAEICGIGHGLMGARIAVETPEQHRFLQALGCHQLQGFLFSSGVSPEKIIAIFAAPENTLFQPEIAKSPPPLEASNLYVRSKIVS